MTDFGPILGFDHLEFYVGNARQAAQFYTRGFGFQTTAYRGLETGDRQVASYVLEQGEIRLVVSTGLSPAHPICQSVLDHGDALAVIALTVPDVAHAYHIATRQGARGAMPPTPMADAHGVIHCAAIHAYGDLLIKFVDRNDYRGIFAPGFAPRPRQPSMGLGLTTIDHVVGSVEVGQMDHWAQFLADTLGFELLVQFEPHTIATDDSALKSKVMQDPTGTIKLPINEPAAGKCKSQIQEYLDYNQGPGVQHVACATDDIIATVSRLRRGGIECLPIPPSYYDTLAAQIGPIREPLQHLAELGILVDRDQDGYLLQIFTRPVVDRPTLFFEIIQRRGSQGFGEGNFRSLFAAIEREQAQRGNLELASLP